MRLRLGGRWRVCLGLDCVRTCIKYKVIIYPEQKYIVSIWVDFPAIQIPVLGDVFHVFYDGRSSPNGDIFFFSFSTCTHIYHSSLLENGFYKWGQLWKLEMSCQCFVFCLVRKLQATEYLVEFIRIS